jgi:hypothetical protein
VTYYFQIWEGFGFVKLWANVTSAPSGSFFVDQAEMVRLSGKTGIETSKKKK